MSKDRQERIRQRDAEWEAVSTAEDMVRYVSDRASNSGRAPSVQVVHGKHASGHRMGIAVAPFVVGTLLGDIGRYDEPVHVELDVKPTKRSNPGQVRHGDEQASGYTFVCGTCGAEVTWSAAKVLRLWQVATVEASGNSINTAASITKLI